MSDDRHARAALAKIRAEVKARWWLTGGRGPYECDDDRYRDEARFALGAVDRLAEAGRRGAAQHGRAR